MRGRRVAFVGNCQANAIAYVYRDFVGVTNGEHVRIVDDTGLEPAAVAEAVQDEDVVVVQEREFNVALKPEALRPGVGFHTFPMLLQAYLWPYAHEPHVLNAPEPPVPDGPYPGQLSDSFLNRLITKGVAPEEALDQYRAHDIASAAHLDRLLELHLDLQRQRDQRTGFDTASVMERDFQSEALFMSPHHSNERLFRLLLSQLFEKMGVAAEVSAMAQASVRKPPFPSGELPLHPGVIKHFGLSFADDDTRYTFHSEGRFTFDQYVLRYMVYAHNFELRKGIHLLHAGDYLNAAESLSKGLESLPQSDQGWRAQGAALRHLGRVDEAVAAYARAVEIAPNDMEAHFDMAQALMQGARLTEAEEAARAALALEPAYGAAQLLLTEILVKDAQPQAAVAAGREALRLLPGQPNTLFWSGAAFASGGELESAKANALAAIAIDPDRADHRNLLAEVFEQGGDRASAIATLDDCALGGAANAQTFSLLGNFHLRSGDHARAAHAFEQGLKIEPDRADLRAQAAHLREHLIPKPCTSAISRACDDETGEGAA